MEFNEYTPKGGWLKYRRNQKVKDRIQMALAIALLIIAYGAAGFIERGF